MAEVWEVFWEVTACELSPGEWVGVSVIYCRVTNHPKRTGLNDNLFLMSLWIGHLGVPLVSAELTHAFTLDDGWKGWRGQEGHIHMSGDWPRQ